MPDEYQVRVSVERINEADQDCEEMGEPVIVASFSTRAEADRRAIQLARVKLSRVGTVRP